MAVPPTIPTSFVPHSASSETHRMNNDVGGAFGIIGYLLFAAAVISALGVFGYDRVLASQQTSKDATLAQAEAALDPATVTNFVRLRDRLSSGETLLSNHVALSGFFTLLEALLPKTVRFSQIHVSTSAQGAVLLTGSGTAKTFNALAATSNALAADGHIKNAIFSSISVDSSGISFLLSATLDPKLVTFTVGSASAGAPAGESTTTTP